MQKLAIVPMWYLVSPGRVSNGFAGLCQQISTHLEGLYSTILRPSAETDLVNASLAEMHKNLRLPAGEVRLEELTGIHNPLTDYRQLGIIESTIEEYSSSSDALILLATFDIAESFANFYAQRNMRRTSVGKIKVGEGILFSNLQPGGVHEVRLIEHSTPKYKRFKERIKQKREQERIR